MNSYHPPRSKARGLMQVSFQFLNVKWSKEQLRTSTTLLAKAGQDLQSSGILHLVCTQSRHRLFARPYRCFQISQAFCVVNLNIWRRAQYTARCQAHGAHSYASVLRSSRSISKLVCNAVNMTTPHTYRILSFSDWSPSDVLSKGYKNCPHTSSYWSGRASTPPPPHKKHPHQ